MFGCVLFPGYRLRRGSGHDHDRSGNLGEARWRSQTYLAEGMLLCAGMCPQASYNSERFDHIRVSGRTTTDSEAYGELWETGAHSPNTRGQNVQVVFNVEPQAVGTSSTTLRSAMNLCPPVPDGFYLCHGRRDPGYAS